MPFTAGNGVWRLVAAMLLIAVAAVILDWQARASVYGGTRDSAAAAVVGLVVPSHAVADYATGFKPSWPGGPLIGLQLYQQPAADFVVEAIVIVIGWGLYRRSLPAGRRRSTPVMLLLITLLSLQLAASVSFALFPGIRKC